MSDALQFGPGANVFSGEFNVQKSVIKRSGISEPWQKEKVSRSILAALEASGVKNKNLAERVVNTALFRLEKLFVQTNILPTQDIREVVEAVLIDHNLVHVVKRYADFHFLSGKQKNTEPIYDQGIKINRYFTQPGVDHYDTITWEKRDARITNEKGKVVFEQTDVEIPSFWSQTATNIVVSKYFHGQVGKADRESSVKQLVSRVAITIANWGRNNGYFETPADAETFEAELTYILVNQMAAFNSPVWFNVGTPDRLQQCSACFINSVQDDMRSILNLVVIEGMLFKSGSGTGTNLSSLRSSKEFLAGSNGKASGPVSFMKGLDAFAGVIKSGGKTRRAAKMVVLNIDHPDIEEFITCKAEEEKKAWALIDAGYDGSIDGSAYSSIFFQNANNSVRVTDDFMNAVINDGEWVTKEVITGNPSVKYQARGLMKKICEATWQCGDPGLQYDTTANKWNTCKKSGRINASNPCSEFMFLDDSACNLSSLNLMKFRKEVNGKMEFDTASFKHTNEIMITAMEIIVDSSAYPTPAIEENSHRFRPLGIGFANLGATLMSFGLAYDSDEGRALAAVITSMQNAVSYAQSARIAEKIGPFEAFKENADSFLEVMKMHREATEKISLTVPQDILSIAKDSWNEVIDKTSCTGIRNAQISLLAPTGTIAFLMDCDTTGIEPDIALVKYKWLVGGGVLKMVNSTVPEALGRLGYTEEEKTAILAHLKEKDTIEGAPFIKDEHLPVFDCAFKATNGSRTIHYMGHLRMMAAVQPFISGAISKTVNMPNEATPEEIETVYTEAWKMGIKAVAVYRDGSKRQQALTTSLDKDQSKKGKKDKPEITSVDGREAFKPLRRRLPDERRAITHKFVVGTYKGYLTVGLYDDGSPGEVFITMAKEGSVISGLADSFATSVSIGLQYGVPLQVLVNKFVHMRFEPSGYTNNPNIRIAKSLVDYIFRWMAMKFMSADEQRTVGIMNTATAASNDEAPAIKTAADETTEKQTSLFEENKKVSLTATFDNQSDAPVCPTCGSIMVRNASCYKCLNCGSTSGCS